MKATGIVRRLDELGRIVLPIELRRNMELDVKDPVEIFVEGDTIVLKKYTATCIFCGKSRDLREFSGKQVCKSCAEKLYNGLQTKE